MTTDSLATQPSHARTRKGEPVHLTEVFCRDAGPGDYQDDECPALHFYVGPTGIKTFGGYKWSSVDGKALRISFKRWYPNAERVKTARSEARAWAEGVRTGAISNKAKVIEEAAKVIKAAQDITVEQVLREFEVDRRMKGVRNAEWAYNAISYSAPEWLPLPLTALTKPMMAKRNQEIVLGDKVKGLAPRGPYAAGILFKAMRALYAFASKAELYQGENIAKKIDLPKESVRRRSLSSAEKAAIIEALDAPIWPAYVKPLFRLLMVTGVRKTNGMTARFDEFDLEDGVWTIPAEKSKNKEAMYIVLRPEAVEIVKAQRKRNPKSPWLFPSEYLQDQPVKDIWYTWKMVLARAEVDTSITIHDLRRTFGSDLASNNVSLKIVAEAMGHRNVATTAKHYAHIKTDAVRAALMGVAA
ncbi:tyrosine-type recombinase/integrase [Variovorax sp. J31P207]|uniref:tyrosine-type recombinase/integrase n=1 Tax=Variovorax sp. J31P207 TaxID=3053510 RepID=UPI0025788985|nr:tyrosine-type recombinase/integrase [Variovorax sp. J31P207]MDM0072011.1 tyrosine-type recombinase/integrase [Variovorax sp. J31P207]